jgi:hypothetical protein
MRSLGQSFKRTERKAAFDNLSKSPQTIVSRLARATAVTAGPFLGGAGLGGYFGVAALGMLTFFIDPLGVRPYSRNAEVLAGIVGSVVGGLLGPLVVWTAPRKVPVWRTFAHTAGGAVLGGIAFFWWNGNPSHCVGGALLGAVAGALVLRLRMRSRPDTSR